MNKKEMNKKEILERLTELQRLLNLPKEELVNEFKSFFHCPFGLEEYYPVLLGWVSGEIDFILGGWREFYD